MSLIKKSDWPSLVNGSWLSNFIDNDRFFDSDWLRKTVPAVNIKENEKNFDIEVAAPGLQKNDFKVSAEKGLLTISAEKKEEKEQKEREYSRKEFSYSSFSRSFALPENSNEDDIKASYENGILKLQVAKKVVEPVKSKKAIEVR